MSTPAIKNREQLMAHLQLLEEKEKFYRARVMADVNEVVEFVKDPANSIKRTVKNLASDGDFRSDLLAIGVNYLGNYIGEKLKTGTGAGGWIGALINKFRGKPEV